MQKMCWKTKILIFTVFSLAGCDATSSTGPLKDADKGLSLTIESAVRNQVFVKGGTFMLGDVGSPDGRPYTTMLDNNKPPVQVTLDSFSISRYETTWGDFMVYLRNVGRQDNYSEKYVYASEIKANDDPQSPNFIDKPARSPNFQEAEGFCQWLADKTGEPFALPTEAQWEYAARNRGKNVPYATNTGTVENDTYLQRPKQYIDPSIPPSGNALVHSSTIAERRPVGSYPPSPLGLYDMTGNVAEWTQDWYQKDYYQQAPSTNPRGPDSPPDPNEATKVIRDWAGRGEHWGGGGTVFSRSGGPKTSSANGFRCVVNNPKPLN